MMPFRQWLTSGNQPLRATLGQPGQTVDILSIQFNTVIDNIVAALVITAAAALNIQQLTTDIGMVNLSCVIVLELDQTAFGATVTEPLPLLGAHLL